MALVREVAPGGSQAARDLERLLALKDQAQYGLESLGGQTFVGALRRARALVLFAEKALGR